MDASAAIQESGISIAIGADGLPVISYHDITNEDLKVAHCNDVACSSAATVTVDSDGDTGIWSSLTIGADGLPVISYKKWGVGLQVAHCNDAACTGAVITSLGVSSNHTSITIGVDGLPVVAFNGSDSDHTVNLTIIHCNDAFCTPFVRRR